MADRLFLKLGEKVEEDCFRYLEEIEDDLEELKNLEGGEIFYGKSVYEESTNGDEFIEENKDLVEDLTGSYELFNSKE